MAPPNNDFAVELIRSTPAFTSGSLTEGPIDLTGRVRVEDIGSINRAIDRDLLNFKTGDMTVSLWNADGYLDDLFAFLGPTDRWQLRVFRRGMIQFWGSVLGLGSIIFDRKEKTCEISAYGLTRQLNDTSAESVTRTIAAMTVTTATATQTTITLNATTGLLPGDTLHVTDHNNKEDLTVKYVASGTVINLVTALANSYASGSEVTCTTQFYRFKSIDYLVRALFAAASIPVADVRLSASQFSTIGPTQLSVGGLGTTRVLLSGACERNNRAYANLDTLGPYYQSLTGTDGDWTNEDATNRPWIDWSRYRTQAQGAPSLILRAPDVIGTANCEAFALGIDDRSATRTIYRTSGIGNNVNLDTNTTTDGTTWTGWVNLYTAIVADGAFNPGTGAEYDPVRNQVYFMRYGNAGNHPDAFLYDVAGATRTDLSLGSTTGYCGFRYIPERDYVLALYGPVSQPTHVSAFRSGVELWRRVLPTNLMNATGLPPASNLPSGATALGNSHVITHGARYINGRIYMLCFRDGVVQLLSTADDFVTITTSSIGQPGQTVNAAIPARVNGAYYFWLYSVASPAATDKRYYIAAPFYAGVIEYADFTAKSVAEALSELAVVTNATFWVDDNAQGHFVARDLYDSGAVNALDESDYRIKERSQSIIWDQSVSYVEISGGGITSDLIFSGLKSFAASGLTLSSDFCPNDAYGQALADAYYAFFGKRRLFEEFPVLDPDGRIYQPLDRVTLNGIRYLVYESDHNLADDSVDLKLLEDA